MSARARSYQRVPQAEVGAISTVAGSLSTPSSDLSAHVGSFDDDYDDDDDFHSNDDADDEDDDAEMLKKKKRTSQTTRSQQAAAWSTKLHALIWIVAASCVAYAIDFFHVIFSDPRIKRSVVYCPCVHMSSSSSYIC